MFGRTGRESREAVMERGELKTEVGKAKGGAGKRTQPEEVVSRMGPLKGLWNRHVVALSCKPEGSGFDSRWCDFHFSLT